MPQATGAKPAPEQSPDKPSFVQSCLTDWRRDLVKAAAFGAVAAFLNKVNNTIADRWMSQPSEALWHLIPLCAGAFLAFQIARGRKEFKIRGAFAVFLVLYVSAFAAASTLDFLDWNRDLKLFGAPGPSSRISPPAFGDWRYALNRRTPRGATRIAIVTVKPSRGRSLEELRAEIAWLIRFAQIHDATGIAFDFYLKDESPVLDRLVCSAVNAAERPVILGYGIEPGQRDFPETLRPCKKRIEMGHLAGFVSSDHVLRDIPLYFQGLPDRPALSVRIAERIARITPVALPASGLLRYAPPAALHTILTLDELRADQAKAAEVEGKFLVVGEDSAADRFNTPLAGKQPGVVIHADAAVSLAENSYFRKPPWYFTALLLVFACYAVMLAAQNGSLKHLLAAALILSAGITALAVLAAYAFAAWIDVIYPVLAIWILVPLAALMRAASRKIAPDTTRP